MRKKQNFSTVAAPAVSSNPRGRSALLSANFEQVKKRARAGTSSRAGTLLPGRGAGFTFALLGFCLFVGIAYVVTVNAQSTTGFMLKQREQSRAQIAREVQDLEQQLSILSSTGMIKSAARSMDLVSVGDADYAAPQTGVAISGGGALP